MRKIGTSSTLIAALAAFALVGSASAAHPEDQYFDDFRGGNHHSHGHRASTTAVLPPQAQDPASQVTNRLRSRYASQPQGRSDPYPQYQHSHESRQGVSHDDGRGYSHGYSNVHQGRAVNRSNPHGHHGRSSHAAHPYHTPRFSPSIRVGGGVAVTVPQAGLFSKENFSELSKFAEIRLYSSDALYLEYKVALKRIWR